MSSNIPAIIASATEGYFGVSESSSTGQELWQEFYSYLTSKVDDCDTQSSVDALDYASLLSSTDTQTVLNSLSSILQTPLGSSPETDALLNTLAANIIVNHGTNAVAGLFSSSIATVNATLIALSSGVTLDATLTTLLAQGAATIVQTGVQVQILYLSFLAKTLDTERTDEASVAISPQEDEERRIAFEVFEIALSMVTVLQNCARIQGNLLYYYATVQQEYTSLMSQLQMYGSAPVQQIIVNTTDFGKTQLGYSNITVRTVTDWLMANIDTLGVPNNIDGISLSFTHDSFGANSDTYDQAGYGSTLTFQLDKFSNGGYQLSISVPTALGTNGSAALTTMTYPLLSTGRWSSGNYSANQSDPLPTIIQDIVSTEAETPTFFPNIFPTLSSYENYVNFPEKLYYANPTLVGTQQTADIVNQLMNHLTLQWNQTPDSTTFYDIFLNLFPTTGSYISSELGGVSSANLVDLSSQTTSTNSNIVITNFGNLRQFWSISPPLAENYQNSPNPIVTPQDIYFRGPADDAWSQSFLPSGSTTADVTAAQQNDTSFRAAANSQLQVYLENARSLKQLAEDTSKRSESVLTQIQESLQNQSSILASITESLQGILAAIFR